MNSQIAARLLHHHGWDADMASNHEDILLHMHKNACLPGVLDHSILFCLVYPKFPVYPRPSLFTVKLIYNKYCRLTEFGQG